MTGPCRRRVAASCNPSKRSAMSLASDYWYLFKLAVKAMVFVVIFGTLGWLLFAIPPDDRPMPSTHEGLMAESLAELPPLELTRGDGHRVDIVDPLTESSGRERQIWGPWEYPATPETWTAHDARYASEYRKRILAALKETGSYQLGDGRVLDRADAEAGSALLDTAIEQNIASKRRQSSAFCKAQEGEWLDMERKAYKASFTVTQWSILGDVRKTQAECQYWKADAARRGGA